MFLSRCQQPPVSPTLLQWGCCKDASGACASAPRVADSIMPGPPPDQVVQPSSCATAFPSARARPQCGLSAFSRAEP